VRRLSSDGTPLPRKETPRSANTIVFDAPAPGQKPPPPRPAARQTPAMAARVPARSSERRRWPWVLGVLAIIAIAWSTYTRLSREGREQRYAQARVDSAHRADSVRKLDSARADSVNRATLVGGMVDSVELAAKARRDSAANIRNALRSSVVAAITRYTNAIQRGDFGAARAAFPRVPEDELTRWQNTLERNDVRLRVIPPREITLRENDLVADADVTLEVRLLDKTTKAEITRNLTQRHATLTRQRQSWELDVFRPR
jgi:hypothetical protein